MSDQAQYQNMMANLNNINQAGKEVVNEKKEDMEKNFRNEYRGDRWGYSSRYRFKSC